MIICITAKNSTLESEVDMRFGRAPWFIRIDTENDQWEALENQAVNQSGGAGIAAAQFVIDHQAEAVLSGDFGPNASTALSASGIKMVRFPEKVKTVNDVWSLIKKEEIVIP